VIPIAKMNGITGPSTTETITGGKTLELSEYDKVSLFINITYEYSYFSASKAA
jgi:hypothetical protein